MFRQSPRKNGRNKGVKVKHVIQISLLLGVSIWLLYQVHHSDDKKVSTMNVKKLKNFTLGRKDLRSKVKETDVNDGKETEERESDEQGIEKEDEEVAQEIEREEREDMKHEELGENERVDDHDESDEKEDGGVKTTKKGNERIKVEKNNGDKGRGRSGVKNEKIQIEREGELREDRGSKKEATKEEKESEKSEEKEQGNKGNKMENKKENVQLGGKERKKKDEGGKEIKEVHKSDTKEHKQSDGAEEIKGKVNKDESNEQNKVVVAQKSETASPHPEEVEMSSSSEDHDQSARDEIENVVNEKESVEDKTIPDSYSAPSFESETTSSMKDDSDIEGQDKEHISNDDVSVLEEEKDALTDLGTLPEAETGGSISHDNAATE